MGGAVGGIIGGVGSIIGGAMGSDAADDAADAQAEAAQTAANAQLEAARISNEEIARQFDLSRQDQLPWLNTGSAALNRLSTLMGIVPSSYGGQAPAMLTEAQIREELLPQFTRQQAIQQNQQFQQGQQNQPTAWGMDAETLARYGLSMPGQYARVYDGTGSDQDSGRLVQFNASQGGAGEAIDEAGLNAAIQQRLAQQQQAQQQWQTQQTAQGDASRNDPLFGSLMRRFTMDDYVEDPGYQFRLGQGEQAINRAAAAAGRYDSGRALKDLTEFNSGLASQEYGNAYSRFVGDQTNQFNRLSALAGTGQTAANTLSELGANQASNIGNLNTAAGNAAAAGAINAGNARASGYMGGANAWSNALGGATNALAQYFNQPSITTGSGFNLSNGLGGSISNPTFSARW